MSVGGNKYVAAGESDTEGTCGIKLSDWKSQHGDRNYEELLEWLSRQTDAFLKEIHDTATAQVKGTTNVLLIDEQITGKPKLFVKDMHAIEQLQPVLGPVPTILQAAKERRQENFPAICVRIVKLPKGHARITNPCTLPFVTPKLIKQSRNIYTRLDPLTPTASHIGLTKEQVLAILPVLHNPPTTTTTTTTTTISKDFEETAQTVSTESAKNAEPLEGAASTIIIRSQKEGTDLGAIRIVWRCVLEKSSDFARLIS
jgi:hypothetical protein